MKNNFSDSILEVKLDRVATNFGHLLSKSSKATECSAVVKADCYGLGAEKIAPRLQETGCKKFFVANLDEAIDLRRILGKATNIYVFHGVKSGEEKAFKEYNITPVINDFYQLEIWSKHATNTEKKLPAIIHIDTGMNRLGFSFEHVDKLFQSDEIKSFNIEYNMSHLSCITEEGHPLNNKQIAKMKEIKQKFDLPCSLANSRGIIAGDEYHFDLVRPGSMIYGVKGNADSANIQNVATLKSRIIQIRELESDSFVGYGAMSAVKKGERIAVVPVGYADGYQRVLSNNSHGHIYGYKIPLIGRVSMDMVIFNISKLPKDKVKVGDFVELFGEHQRIDELADRANTIGYEILTSLGNRYKRVYV